MLDYIWKLLDIAPETTNAVRQVVGIKFSYASAILWLK